MQNLFKTLPAKHSNTKNGPTIVQKYVPKSCPNISQNYPEPDHPDPTFGPKNVSSLLARMEEVLDAREANMVS